MALGAPPSGAASARASACAEGRVVRRLDRAQVEQDRPTLDTTDDRRLAGPKPARQGVRARPDDDQSDRLERRARQRPAADRRFHLRHRNPVPDGGRERGQDRIGPPAQVLGRRGDHPPDGDVGDRPAGPVEPERRGERGQGHLLGSNGAGQRVLPDPRDEVGATDDQPGLRPTDQLVAAERDQVGAGGEALGRRRLVGEAESRGLEQGPAPQVVDDDRAVLVGEPGELDRIRCLDEPGLREVRRMDAQDDGRPPVRERRFEVGGAGPVRRPDLDEARAGSSDDLRDADATADLDQLAARDRDAMLAGQPDREHESRGVVDGDEGVLGAGQRDQVVLHGTEPGAAMPGGPVEFEQRIGAGRTRRRLDGDRRPRRTSEVGVEDHPGRVEDRGQATLRRVREALEPLADGPGEIVQCRRLLPGRQARPLPRHHVPRDRRDRVRRSPIGQLRADGRKQPFDARGTRTIGRHWPSVAGTRGSRTHRAAPSAAPLVLKTRGPTGTRPLPSRW